MDTWREDRNGCAGVRAGEIAKMEHQKGKLLGLSELDIVKVLGKPDVNELSKRNQKFYYYYIESGPACGALKESNPVALAIRFNAMGLAKEVRLEKVYR